MCFTYEVENLTNTVVIYKLRCKYLTYTRKDWRFPHLSAAICIRMSLPLSHWPSILNFPFLHDDLNYIFLMFPIYCAHLLCILKHHPPIKIHWGLLHLGIYMCCKCSNLCVLKLNITCGQVIITHSANNNMFQNDIFKLHAKYIPNGILLGDLLQFIYQVS